MTSAQPRNREAPTSAPSVLADPAADELVRLVLTRCIGRPKTAAPDTTNLCRALAWYATATAVTPRGDHFPAIDPTLVAQKIRGGQALARRLGWERYEHHERWQAGRRRCGMRIDFGAEIVTAFVAPVFWPVVDALVGDGPTIAQARAFEALHLLSERGVRGNRRRPAGPPSVPYLKLIRHKYHLLFESMFAIRCAGIWPERLVAWDHVPRVELPDLPRGGYEVSAPPPHLVRAKLDELTREIHARLRIDQHASFDEEAEAITTIGPSATVGLWRPFQRRMLLGLYAIVGGRKDAIMLLRRSDFVRELRFADGSTGPALRLRPRKRAGRWLVRTKRLHPELGALIANYLLFVDRRTRLAYADPKSIDRETSPRPAGPRMPPSAPLVPISVSDWRPLNPSTTFAGGIERDKSGRLTGAAYALIPRVGELPDGIPEELRPYIGYTPHEYRHLAYQLGVRAGVLYNERHVGSGAETWARPELYGHAMLDHGNPNNLGRIYGDFGTEAAIQTLTARAIHGAWALLATEAGARRRPDVAKYMATLTRLDQLENELAKLSARAAKLANADVLQSEPSSAPEWHDVHAKLDHLIRQNRTLLRRMDALRALTLEGHSITHQILQLTEQRAALVKRLECLRLDTRTWLAIPDREPPPPPVDWSEIDRRVLGRAYVGPQLVASAPSARALAAPTLNRNPPRYWTDARIRAELAQLLVGRYEWPKAGEFRARGLYGLYQAVRRHRGREYWAREFDLPVPDRGAGPPRYRWSDDRIRAALADLLSGRGKWPSRREFSEAGMPTLSQAISVYGGTARWAREFGFEPPEPFKPWTDSRIQAELDSFLRKRADWPRYAEFKAAGKEHLYQALQRHGGLAHWRESSGLPPLRHRHRAPKWTEERIRSELTVFLAGRSEWPSRREFGAAGLSGLWAALWREPGIAAWAEEFGYSLRPPTRTSVEAAVDQKDGLGAFGARSTTRARHPIANG